MTVVFARPSRVALLAVVTSIASASVRAAPPFLDLEVELDPGTRHLKVSALVVPESRDFRFALHESLQVTAASADGKMLRIVSTGRAGAVGGWQVQVPADSAGLRLEYGGTLPVLDRNLDDRGVLRRLPPMASNEGSFLPAGGAWYPQPAALIHLPCEIVGARRSTRAGARPARVRGSAHRGFGTLSCPLRILAARRGHRPHGRALGRSREDDDARERRAGAAAHLFLPRPRCDGGAG